MPAITRSAPDAGSLPSEADVLVVGAGPAGSATAWSLASRGLRVALVDRRAFPRDKACGDALIPDALGVLERIGAAEAVLAAARIFDFLRIVSPKGTPVDLRGRFATLPRRELDHLLVRHARAAGARFFAPFWAVGPLERRGRVEGARFEAPGDGPAREVRARLTVLATGAAAAPLAHFGVLRDREPGGTAVRAYVRPDARIAARHPHLSISYQREICPGYGWVFPGPDGVFNIGAGTFRGRRLPGRGVVELWREFTRSFPPARELLQSSRADPVLRGAPLRTGLAGALPGRPGLVVAGEAVGTTYPFSGEGIGKAMESGLLAADAVAAALNRAGSTDGAHREYAGALRAEFSERYRAYRLAQERLSRPWLCDLLARRANAGTFVRRELEGLLAETADPRELFSVFGLLRSLFR